MIRNLHVKGVRQYAEHEVEVWYINTQNRNDRKECMEKQIKSLGIEPHRFEAISPAPADLKEGGKYADCKMGGFREGNVYSDATAGGGKISSGGHTRMAVIGNTCSHKR